MDTLDDSMIVFGCKVIHNSAHVGLERRGVLEAGLKVVFVVVSGEAKDEAGKEVCNLGSVQIAFNVYKVSFDWENELGD